MNEAYRLARIGIASRYLLVASCATVLICGCQPQNTYQEPPPPPVTVANPELRTVVKALEFTGTTQPYALVDVRARVEGFLLSIDFEEGTSVKEGDLLFQIDPKPFEAILAQAQASEKLGVARLASAKAEVKRTLAEVKNAEEQLMRVEAAVRVSPGAVTDEEIESKKTAVLTAKAAVDAANASVASSEAEIAAAQAQVTQAELDLSYCRVVSPIDGRVGRRLVDVGNLVGAGESTVLTNIVSYDPIYVFFNVNENDLLQFMKESETEDPKLREAEVKLNQPIQVGLADTGDYPISGVAEYGDLAVDQSTGTYLIRGKLPNKRRMIPPGAFARVRVPRGEIEALLIDPRAISRDQTGAYLLVVDSEDVVERRDVQLVGQYDGLQAVSGSISAEDRVIVNGLQRARPGRKVVPQMKEPATPEVPKETEGSEPAPEETPASDSEE